MDSCKLWLLHERASRDIGGVGGVDGVSRHEVQRRTYSPRVCVTSLHKKSAGLLAVVRL